MDYRAYKQLISILKKRCPVAFPVSIRRVKLTDLDGDCTLGKKKFYIRIDRSLSEASAIDTLLHEWAHARAWNHRYDTMGWEEWVERQHDASWGVAYSEVYRVYEQYFLTRDDVSSGKCNKWNYK